MSTAVALLQQKRLALARAQLDAQRVADALLKAQGKDGKKGEKGDTGPMPDHEWKGTKLRFEKPDGSWGELVELRGPKGARGDRGAGGQGGASQIAGPQFDPSSLSMAADMPTPDEVLVQQDGAWVRATWAQFIGWMGAPPPVSVDAILTEDGLRLLAEDGAALVAESATSPTAGRVLTEIGDVLLTEDDRSLEME